jgi:hypothetical protein
VQFKLSQANDYRARAKECRRLTAIAAEYLRENYLALARSYEQLAENSELPGRSRAVPPENPTQR